MYVNLISRVKLVRLICALVQLEDLFVKPEHRSCGVGKAMFSELGKIAEDKGCARMDWVVLKWNQPSIDFYRHRLGAISMDDWMGMRLEETDITKLKTLAPEGN